MPNIAWGIDIGNRALKGVKLQRTGEGLKIIDFAFIEHDTILSESGDNREPLIQTALAKFVGRHDVRKIPVCVGVSGQQSFARFVKLPPVEPKKIPEIVKFEAVQQIPFPLDEVEWSYQLFENPDDPDIEVGIFAIRKELVNDRVGNLMEVDLDVHAVQTGPLAVYNAMRFDGRLDKGHSIIIDLGADSTDLIIADAQSIWMRSLDIGGNNFTEALAKAFKIDFEKAEEMKRNAKTSKYAKQIYQAMRPVFGELVGEVQRSLGFFHSTHREVKLRKVVALGGGFKLNGLSGYVQKNLQMPVEKPTKFAALPPDEPGTAAALSEHLLSAAAAYGMSLQVLEETKVTSSLLPTHIRKDKMWRDKTKWFGLAAGLIAGAALVGLASYLYNDLAFNSAQAERARLEVDRIIGEARQLDERWTAVTQAGRGELQQVRNVNALVTDRLYWPHLIAMIHAAMPAPEGELANALAGNFGQPGVLDEEDAAVIQAVPREQRQYVEILRIESVYSNDLAGIANSAAPVAAAQNALERRSRGTFEGVQGTAPRGEDGQPGQEDEAGTGAQVIEDPEARGFVIRMTLRTPMPYEQAVERFRDHETDSILERLVRIGPDEANPDLPFLVRAAYSTTIRSYRDSPERLRELEASYNARVAISLPEEGAEEPNGQPGAAAGRAPAARPDAQQGPIDENHPAYIDPLTGESLLQDTEIQVIFIVLLDPPRYTPEEADGQPQVAGGELEDDQDFND